ncbi:ESX-1 secretion system protein eccCa1 [Mycobacterium tuberculosis]|nr:type VII secretion protein EccCa [Mycobacterium tuberculosis]CMH33197.1 ESX-1 secretion system protein eccCa1 [Mycobacterium tuberculosis]
MGLRLTTKVQVSGWRFLLRRLEHAIVRRDTRMFDDPLQFYSRSIALGIVVAVLILAGAALLAYFKPQGKLGGTSLFTDRATNQLYVLLSGQLHPVYNLTSARLVLGNPANPATVKSSELSKLPMGQTVGIPGAPYATPVSAGSTSIWTLCDTVARADSTSPVVQTAVIAMPLEIDASIDPLQSHEAVLVSYQGETWIVTTKGRHAIDLTDRALTSSMGIPVTARPTPISEGMFNALPDMGPWQLPPIPAAGAPNSLGLPDDLVIGSVFQIHTDKGPQYYVVLPDGIAQVNATTAAALRATQAHGLVAPPAMVPSLVVRIAERVYPSPLPDEPLKIVSRPQDPALCWSWQRSAGDQSPQSTVLSGRHLPISPSAMNMGIKQIHGTATVYLDGGKFVALQSPDPRYTESMYYIDPQGVRYGVPNAETAKSLGLRTHGLIHDCPKLLQLRTFPTIAIGGDLAGAAGLMTAMICHLAVFHPPDLLQIRVLTEEPDDPDWSWLKWLPHVQHQTETDAAGSTRLIFTRQEGLSDLAARGPHAPDSLPGGPYVVVVDLTGGKAGFPPDGRAGVTVITLGNHRGSAYRIRVHEDGTADDRLPNQSFRQVTSVTDRMSPQQASRIARKLAGWSITGTILDKTSRVQKKVATDWHQLVGAQSVEEITPSRWRMYTDTDRDRLKIPFGHELKTGNVMYLDIKEGAEFGAGPHGMLIGTTGSGKSEFLRTLILSLVAMTHPDQVNLLLTDFKGGSTFLGMEKLPHTAAVVTNMAEEAELVSRMGEVLTGELDRRQSILRQAGMKVGAAGALSGVAEYEKYRERGADLPPLPTLFVVVDEFAELLQSHPDFIGLFDRICRVGRSLRVHLLLATQSLQTGGVRIDKLEPNLTYRIALRTTSSHESKAVIGTPEAQYITNKESGVGFLRVGMEDPVKFSTFYISGPYMPPAAGVETNGEAGGPGQQTTRQAARIHRFTAAPVLEEAPTP